MDKAAVENLDAFTLYENFRANVKTNPNDAYASGRAFLQKYAYDDQYSQYVRRWIAAYTVALLKIVLQQSIDDQKYAEALVIAKQILTDAPEDLSTLVNIVRAGLKLAESGNRDHDEELAGYAKKALRLIEAGKTYERGKPFVPQLKEEIRSWLNYALGFLLLRKRPDESVNALIDAARSEGSLSSDPTLYILLGESYETGLYRSLLEDYQARFKTDEARDSAEGRAALEKLNQVIDAIIDAFARAVAYIGQESRLQQAKPDVMSHLNAFYKYRNNGSESGLDQLIAGVTAKPLPRLSR